MPVLNITKEERASRREAAAKIAANKDAVAARLLSHSGIVRAQGSPFGETLENVNGVPAACARSHGLSCKYGV